MSTFFGEYLKVLDIEQLRQMKNAVEKGESEHPLLSRTTTLHLLKDELESRKKS